MHKSPTQQVGALKDYKACTGRKDTLGRHANWRGHRGVVISLNFPLWVQPFFWGGLEDGGGQLRLQV